MATDTTGTTTNDSTRAPISTNQLVLGAVVAAIQAKREAAIAQISLYVNNPASITDCNSFLCIQENFLRFRLYLFSLEIPRYGRIRRVVGHFR